jgi:Protein of unknown function (DUF2865)
VSLDRELRRVFAPFVRPIGRRGAAVLALCGMALAGGGLALAQGLSDQQIRCMQLQEELAAARGGGGGFAGEDVGRIEQQIAQADRVFQGTQAAMEDAGCFESFFIFGRGLVRSPKCLKMNARVEDARRQLTQLQQQRQAISGGGGNKRRQAELSQAMARAGCGGVAQPRRGGGGLFDFFGGGQQPEEYEQTPIYRSIDPNGRYRSVCVRLCDGFFYPVREYAVGSQLAQDAERCQSNCAAPAELYVYRTGREIEQAISLQGSAYMDLPVALKFRKEYVKGCSCKQAEYSPTEIEAANKRAALEATAATPGNAKPGAKPAAPPPPAAAAAPAPEAGPPPALDLDITGTTEPTPPAPGKPQAEVTTEIQPPPPLTAEGGPPAAPAKPSPAPGQSSMSKSKSPAPAPQ